VEPTVSKDLDSKPWEDRKPKFFIQEHVHEIGQSGTFHYIKQLMYTNSDKDLQLSQMKVLMMNFMSVNDKEVVEDSTYEDDENANK